MLHTAPCPLCLFHRRWRSALAGLAVLLSQGAVHAAASPAQEALAAGAGLYLEGRLPGGEPLRARVAQGRMASGAEVACVTCHRPSGMGGIVKRTPTPAITARHLFQPAPAQDSTQETRPAYTEATLTKALVHGVDTRGLRLHEAMPRYLNLDERAVNALIAYLQHLNATPPGVDSKLHFATVFTPEATPAERDATLGVLKACATINAQSGVQKPWQIDAWELSGPPQTWEEQLRARLAATPVLALVGGVGQSEWRPVHRFCKQQAIPCLFADVDSPPSEDESRYTLYFSGGLRTEAGVLAKLLPKEADTALRAIPRSRMQASAPRLLNGVKRMLQVYRPGGEGAAAQVLRAAAKDARLPLEDLIWNESDAVEKIAANLQGLSSDDAVVLWLREADLMALSRALGPAPQARRIFISETLVNPRRLALGADWRSRLGVLSVYDQAEKRHARSQLILQPWLKKQGLTLSNERRQTAAFSTCAMLAGAIHHAGADLSREYLLESIQAVAGTRGEASLYPGLHVQPGQPFASRTGHILRYTHGRREQALVDETGWILP